MISDFRTLLYAYRTSNLSISNKFMLLRFSMSNFSMGKVIFQLAISNFKENTTAGKIYILEFTKFP